MIHVIVTIDGPAGAGKSTAALGLAETLGFKCLDTGAMYRAVGLLVSEQDVDPLSDTRCSEIAEQMNLRWDEGRLFVNERDRSEDIRKPKVTKIVKEIAVHPSVRLRLVRLQREAALGKDIVTEGRDQGTVVFPSADVKFYLDATPEIRAERRLADLRGAGEDISYEQVLDSLNARDGADHSRAIAPLRRPEDAVSIDTTHLTLEQMVDTLLARILRIEN